MIYLSNPLWSLSGVPLKFENGGLEVGNPHVGGLVQILLAFCISPILRDFWWKSSPPVRSQAADIFRYLLLFSLDYKA